MWSHVEVETNGLLVVIVTKLEKDVIADDSF